MFEKRQNSGIKIVLDFRNLKPKSILRFAAIFLFAFVIPLWLWLYLRPDTWRYYTDEVEFSRIKRKAKPQLVVWDDAKAITGVVNKASQIAEPVISPDGSIMAFTRKQSRDNEDIYFSKWNGTEWQEAKPARALNSRFNEKSPAFSRNGKLMFFSTDRPGGPGGYDIWVSRWDGAEYAWPVPLTIMVNSPYDDIGPSPSASEEELYFSSNRPRQKDEQKAEDAETARSYIIEEKQTKPAEDYDIFSAHIIPSGVTNREVERAISMLYYLREAALSDEKVMNELGGSPRNEQAIDRALEYLKNRQEDDGSWRQRKGNKGGKHDVACTSLALLTFFGRGHRHDREGPYQKTVSKGLDWLMNQQKPLGEIYGRGDFYDQGIGTLALGEAYGLTKDEKIFDAAHTAIDYIVECQNTDGGWRYKKDQSPSDLSVSGWMIMALKNAELSGLYVPESTFAGIRKWLTTVGSGEHGGIFSYQKGKDNRLPMKVTGYFCSQLMGLSPNTMKSFEAAEIMLKKGPLNNDFYYLYYGTLAANQHQGPLWKNWQKKFPEIILPLQQPDGSWNQNAGSHGNEMREVIGTALITLSLQAHYRYTPMFGLGYQPDERKEELSAKNRDELEPIPLYRRAKRRYRLSSEYDDLHPAVTEHGDFLYFASDRNSGYGGFDIYRSRISGEKPTKPENLGDAVNSPNDETAPTTRAAGFDLIFCSNREQGNPNNHLMYSSVSKRVHIKTNPFKIANPFWFIKTFPWQIIIITLAVLFFVYWFTKLRVRHAAKTPRGPPPTLSLKIVRFVRKWAAPVVSIFIVFASIASINSTLKKTVWRVYTDGKDIKRSAMKENARPVLWNTHITLGELNRPRPVIAPVFSPDESELTFHYISSKTKDPVYYTSKWDGTSWSKAENIEEEVQKSEEEKKPEPEQNKPKTPAVLQKFPDSSNISGGYQFFAEDKLGSRGRHDIFFEPIESDEKASNLGPFVNSKDDDLNPSARMEGFDIMFVSDRGQEEENKYVLFTSTAREVVEHMDYTRWHNLVSLLNRLKWWIFAMVVAGAGLAYLVKHWSSINSLFHKCLLGSLGVHLLILLLMAFWMVSAEFVESVETTAMEISVDVNALAQEKLALELEQDVTEMEDLVDAHELEQQQQETPEIPLLEAETTEETPVVEVETSNESFVEEIEPVEFTEPETEMPELKELEPLPEMEMPEIEISLEMEEAPEEETPEEKPVEKEPEITQEEIEIEKLEIEEITPEVETAETENLELTEPEVEVTPLEMPVTQEPTPLPEPVEVTMTEPVFTPVEVLPEIEMPEPELEVQQTESSKAEEEYKPAAAQESAEVEKSEQVQPTTEALSDLAEVSQLTISNTVAVASIEELIAETASSLTETERPREKLPEQILEVFEVAMEEVQLEVQTTETSKTEAFQAVSGQSDVEIKKAEHSKPATDADSEAIEIAELNLKTEVISEQIEQLPTETAKAKTETEKLKETKHEQMLDDVELVLKEIELEVETTDAPQTTVEFIPTSKQERVDVARAQHVQPTIEASREVTETTQLNIRGSLKTEPLPDIKTSSAVSASTEVDFKEIKRPANVLPEMEIAKIKIEMEAQTVTAKIESSEKFTPTAFSTSSDVSRESTALPSSRIVTTKTTTSDVRPVSEQQPINTQRIMDSKTIRTTFSTRPTTAKITDTPHIKQTMSAIEVKTPNIEMEVPVAATSTKKAAEFKPIHSITGTTSKRQAVDLSEIKVRRPAKRTDVSVQTAVQVVNIKSSFDAEAADLAFSQTKSTQAAPQPTSAIEARLPEMQEYTPNVEMAAPAYSGIPLTKTKQFVPAGVQGKVSASKQVVSLPSTTKKIPTRYLPETLVDNPAKPVVKNVTLTIRLSDRRPAVPLPGNEELASNPVSTDKAGPELKIDLPGELSIPPGAAAKLIPEIMKDPSKLSSEIIESLGGSADTQGSIVESLDWFTKNQEKDGHWSLGKHGGNSAHDIGGTSLVLLCYYGWGAKHNQPGKHQETVKIALDWLKSKMQKDGDLRGWLRRRYEADKVLGNMYDHSIGTIALCEAYSLTKDESLLEPATRAIKFLIAAQNKEMGGWRYKPGEDSDTSSLGWAYMALKSAEMAGIEVPKETFERAERWLKRVSGGKSSGTYGYQKHETKRPAMVATGMFCRQLAGIPKTDPRMYESVSYIATHPLTAEEIDFYYIYYGTLVLYQHQGPAWEKWNAQMKAILLSKQHKKGRKAGSWDPSMWYGFQMGRVGATAIGTLSLEVYYRLLPMYGFEDK